MKSAVVIGAGSWGSALSMVLAENLPHVTLWIRRRELYLSIKEKKENAYYLPGVFLPDHVELTNDMEEAVHAKDVVVLAVPSHALRDTACLLKPFIKAGAVLVNCAKGIEAGTLLRMSAVLEEELPLLPSAVLSGPNHAEEVGRRIPSATVVSSKELSLAEMVQELFMTPFFRVYTNPDLVGVELGGALKNVIALGAGISDGLGFGDNTKAALITRGLTEITRLGKCMGANPLTFAGLSGIGDLVVTCTSKHSRNHNLGLDLGKGKKLQDVLAGTRMVAEGVRTTQAAWSLAQQYGVEMPITNQTYQVLFSQKDPRAAVEELMRRIRKHEREELVSYRQESW